MKIVAEISANHNGNLDRAMALIEAAKFVDADAVKIQAYDAEDITIDCDRAEFTISAAGPWQGRKLIELYRAAATPYHWLPQLFKRANDVGIECFASVFSKSAIDRLEQLNCPAYKIASFEATDVELIRYAAATKKPIIISAGVCSFEELMRAVTAAKRASSVTLLHCVSKYPTEPGEADLGMIRKLQLRFQKSVGFSDHTMSLAVPVVAVALGAEMLEKHLTLSRHDTGPDAAFSLDPAEFSTMVRMVREAESALVAHQGLREDYRGLRRSLYAVKDIGLNQEITEDNVKSIRPGAGLEPYRLPELLGRRAKEVILRGTPMRLELVG